MKNKIIMQVKGDTETYPTNFDNLSHVTRFFGRLRNCKRVNNTVELGNGKVIIVYKRKQDTENSLGEKAK